MFFVGPRPTANDLAFIPTFGPDIQVQKQSFRPRFTKRDNSACSSVPSPYCNQKYHQLLSLPVTVTCGPFSTAIV